MVLMFFGALFVTVTIAGYKYETQSQQHDPKEWSVSASGRRSQCMISFEIALPGSISTIAEKCYDNIAAHVRGVPFPQHVFSKKD